MFLAAAWYHNILATLFALVAILLVLVILLQRGKGTGLSGAFGGSGGTSATFGSKTGDFLTWITVAGATLLLLFAIVLNYIFRPLGAVGAPGGTSAGETDAGGTETPAETGWNIEDRDTWPEYVRGGIFGEDQA